MKWHEKSDSNQWRLPCSKAKRISINNWVWYPIIQFRTPLSCGVLVHYIYSSIRSCTCSPKRLFSYSRQHIYYTRKFVPYKLNEWKLNWINRWKNGKNMNSHNADHNIFFFWEVQSKIWIWIYMIIDFHFAFHYCVLETANSSRSTCVRGISMNLTRWSN